MDDAELLRGLAGVCQRLLEAAHKQVGEQFGTNPDDARWPYPFPLKSDLQIKHLFVQTEDAFNVAGRTSRFARPQSASGRSGSSPRASF